MSVTGVRQRCGELRKLRRPDISGPSRPADDRLFFRPPIRTMEYVTPTLPLARARARRLQVVCTDLERFWPSRRGHAFDEFCR